MNAILTEQPNLRGLANAPEVIYAMARVRKEPELAKQMEARLQKQIEEKLKKSGSGSMIPGEQTGQEGQKKAADQNQERLVELLGGNARGLEQKGDYF